MNIYTWLKTRMCTPNNNATCTWNSAHHGVMTTYNACNKCINWIHKLNRKISYLSSSFIRQESLANAKVSTWQPWYIGRKSQNQPDLGAQRNSIHHSKVYFQCATSPSLTMQVYLHSFSCCCLPNMPTSGKFPENLNLQQFKVIQY